MAFQRNERQIVLESKFTNFTSQVLGDWALQFNVNSFGVQLGEPFQLSEVQPGSSYSTVTRISSGVNPTSEEPGVPFFVQIAVRSSLGIFYFQTPCMFSTLLVEEGRLDRDQYRTTWQSIGEANEFSHSIGTVNPKYQAIDSLKQRLESNNIFLVTQRTVSETGEEVMYCSSKTVNDVTLLSELRVLRAVDRLTIAVKTSAGSVVPLFIQALNFLLSTTL
jgi:AP-1 complex subunit beta-1